MLGNTTNPLRDDQQCKRDFYHKYSEHVYSLAFSITQDKETSLGITRAAFIKAFDALAVDACSPDDQWPFLYKATLEEVLLWREAAQGLESGQKPQPEPNYTSTANHQGNRFGRILLLLLNIMLSLLLAWVLVGFLARLGVLPYFNLGHLWFNTRVFPLF